MSTILFLQNAWSPVYAGGVWPRKSWLRALERSRSGLRLRALIDDFDICENTTPIVGDSPDSIIKPDVEHIAAQIELRQPSVVIACGKQAEGVVGALWGGPLLVVPHPAHRLLTTGLYAEGRALLRENFTGRIALRQLRDLIFREDLSTTREPLPLINNPCGAQTIIADGATESDAVTRTLGCELAPNHDGAHSDGVFTWDERGPSR